jgi:hypothetical protein
MYRNTVRSGIQVIARAAAVLRSLRQEIETTNLAYDLEEHSVGICASGTAFRDSLGREFSLSIPVPTARFAGKRPRDLMHGRLIDRHRDLPDVVIEGHRAIGGIGGSCGRSDGFVDRLSGRFSRLVAGRGESPSSLPTLSTTKTPSGSLHAVHSDS